MGPCRSHECFKPAFSFRGGGGGVGSGVRKVLKKVLLGEASPQGLTFIYHF